MAKGGKNKGRKGSAGNSGGGSTGRPRLDPEDSALWDDVIQTIKPLKGRRAKSPAVNTSSPSSPSRKNTSGTATPVITPQKIPAIPKQGAHTPGLDHRTEQKLRTGKLDIEGRLDLHGMTQAQAHAALDRFIVRALAAHKRCLLIITGKGRGGSEGVLRRNAPLWLREGPAASDILRIVPAVPAHGGNGAFYVYLRRHRS